MKIIKLIVPKSDGVWAELNNQVRAFKYAPANRAPQEGIMPIAKRSELITH